MSPAIFPTITGLVLLGLFAWCVCMVLRAYREIFANIGPRGAVIGTVGVIVGMAVFGLLVIVTP